MPSIRPAVSRFRSRFLAPSTTATRRLRSRRATNAAALACLLIVSTAPSAAVAPPNVSISPKTQTVNRAYGISQSETYSVTNTGNTSGTFTVTYTCSGVLQCSGSQTNTLTAGQVWNISISHYNEQVGTGTLTVTASTSGASDQAVTTVQIYAPAFTLSPMTASETKPASSAQSSTFTVTNTAVGELYFTTGVNCNTGTLTGCSVSPTGFLLAAGAQRVVTANYTTGAAASTGAFAFTAYTTGLNKTGTITVTAASGSAAVSVTPKGTTVARPSWTSPTDTFTVTNTGAASGSFTIVKSCGGTYVTCTGSTTTQTIAAGASVSVPLAYETHGPPPGTDWVRVKATTGSLTDSATANVNVVAPGGTVAISPSSASKPASSAQSSTFTVTNSGTARSTYTLSVSCTAPLTACSVPAPTSITVNAGQSASVPVNYTTGAAGSTGTITLTASTPNITPSATLTVTAATVTAVTVTPKGQTVTWPSWTSPKQTYTVTNTGSAATTFTIVKSCGGSHVTCTAQGGTTTQIINAGASATIDFTYETHGPPPGTGWVRLKASSGAVADSATTNVNAVAPGGSVAVSPSSVTKPATSAQSSSFTVTNGGTATSTYTLSVSCTAPLTACSVPAPTSITVNAGQSASVPVNYTTGAAGSTGTITLTASTPNITPNATLSVTAANTNGVAVTPKGSSTTLGPSTSGNTFTFTVQNTGTAATTFALTGSCSGAITCAYSNSISPNAGVSTPVQLTFATSANNTGANQTGTLTLSASGGGVSDAATYTVTVTPMPTVTVAARALGLDGSVARDACLDMPLGKGASYECADLRVAYALPAMTTMNKTRQPTLLYLSSHANASAEIAVDVSLQFTTPSQVVPRLTVTGKAPITYPAVTWDPNTPAGTPRRITVPVDGQAMGLATGTYPYTLQVDVTTSSGTVVQGSDSGSVTIVNRIASPFGRGWWVEGYEQLVTLSNPSRLLWVGGDGSTRVYTPSAQAPNTYTVKSPLNRPDTLVYVFNASNPSLSYYQRRLPNGARTEFDGFLRHVRTINAQGHVTRFQHAFSGRLNSIELPTPGGATIISYGFNYQPNVDNQNVTRLESIHLAGPGVADQASYFTTLPTGWLSQIQFLLPSDTGWASSGAITKFTYSPDLSADPGAGTRNLVSLEDPDQHVIQFEYESGKLRRSTIPLPNPVDNIVNAFCPAELRGRVAPSTAPPLPRCSIEAELLSNAYTWVDGPRTDVGDYSGFHINRFGAPDTVVNALSKITRFIRDLTFPLLAKSTINPNGLTTNIVINNRGLPDRVTVVDPLDYNHPDSNAVTKYTWHNTWNLPLTITTPTNEVTTFTYETAVAVRKTQMNGFASTTTTFGYNPYWQVNSVTPPSNGSSSASYPDVGTTYDALGNLETVRSRLGTTSSMIRDAIGRVKTTLTPIENVNNLVKYLESTVAYYASGLPFRETTTGPLLQGMVLSESVTLEHTYKKSGLPISVRRTFTPDPSASQYGTSGLLTSWEYDAAGRRTKETGNDGFNEITSYDPAGNVTRVQPKRRATYGNIDITMSYDVLNRMKQRVVPALTQQALQGMIPANFSISNYGVAANDEAFYLHDYPQYPTQGIHYWIPPDVTDFVYDDVTNQLLTATNGDGRVARTYFKGGLLKTETQQIQTQNRNDLTKHSYTLENKYDLSGRRRELIHPATLRAGASGDRTTWAYDDVTGYLKSVVDVANNQINFYYYPDGSLLSISRPGQIEESMWYDADGRLVINNVTSAGSPSRPWAIGTQVLTVLRQDNLSYDLRDKLRSVNNTLGFTTTRTNFYTTLGHLFGSDVSGTNPRFACCATQFSISERYSYNGLGDIVDSRPTIQYNSTQTDPGFLPHRYSGVVTQGDINNTFDANGRLVGVQHTTGNYNYDDVISYDAAGNRYWSTQWNQGITIPRDESVSYYGADNKLRAIDRRQMPDESNQMYKSVFEEYRYDPLGRRTWVRTRQWCQGANEGNGWCRLNKVRRIIWDGDQELYEIQMPDSASATFDFAENDVDPVPVTTPFSIQVPGGTLVQEMRIDPNLMFGRVAYTPGVGVDAPISVVRFGYVSTMESHDGNTWMPAIVSPVTFPTFGIMPHWNSQGKAELGTVADGGATICNPTPFRCAEVFWPRMLTAYGEETGAGQRTAWFGTLLEDKRDASGLLYRRNRMYDPVSGRFTQEDPAGVAGGLNLYGYAGGDPVNHSDPFGLCLDGLSTLACLYAAFEIGSTAYDLYDLGRTAIRYSQGRESGSALAVTAAGAGAGLIGFGGGYGRMARGAMNALDDLSSAAKAADRGGLTRAGRALAKHNAALGNVKGSPVDLNRAGQEIVDDILTNPGSQFSARHHARFGDVIEVRAPDGRGVRYNSKNEFMGFLEPNK